MTFTELNPTLQNQPAERLVTAYSGGRPMEPIMTIWTDRGPCKSLLCLSVHQHPLETSQQKCINCKELDAQPVRKDMWPLLRIPTERESPLLLHFWSSHWFLNTLGWSTFWSQGSQRLHVRTLLLFEMARYFYAFIIAGSEEHCSMSKLDLRSTEDVAHGAQGSKGRTVWLWLW